MKLHRLELSDKYIHWVMKEVINELWKFLTEIHIDITLQYIIDSHISINKDTNVSHEHQIVKLIWIGDIFKDWKSVRISTLTAEDIITLDKEKVAESDFYKTLIIQSIIDKSKDNYVKNHPVLSDPKYKKSWYNALSNIELSS